MPLLWPGISFLAGIFLSAQVQTAGNIWAGVFLAGLLTAVSEVHFSREYFHPLLSKKLFNIPFSLIVAAFALGGWRFQAANPVLEPDDLAFYQPDKNAVVTGTVISFPELAPADTSAIIKAETITINGKLVPVKGKLELRLPGGFHLSYGDRLEMAGEIKSVFGKDVPLYQSYLARRGILTRMAYPQVKTLGTEFGSPGMAVIYNLRESAFVFIQNQMPFEEAALLSGILLGIDWRIPEYLVDAYRITGTVHIIAISGFNIALITGLVIRLFRRILTPVPAAILALFSVLVYILLVGLEPSVVRAAIMGSLSIPAYYIGRRAIGLNSLTVAAAGMALINPLILWDIGFQLSFLATLGLMVLADPLIQWISDRLEHRYPEGTVQSALPAVILVTSTLSAQFAVSPVILTLQPAIQLFSLPANLIILPLQPPLMVLGSAALLAYSLFPPIGILLVRIVWLPARFCNLVVLHFAKVRIAEIALPETGIIFACCLVLPVLVLASIRQIQMLAKPAEVSDDL